MKNNLIFSQTKKDFKFDELIVKRNMDYKIENNKLIVNHDNKNRYFRELTYKESYMSKEEFNVHMNNLRRK